MPETNLIHDLGRSARQHTTPCGSGHVVWREWGDGPSLVLLHGGFGSWLHWVRNIQALSTRFRVLAVDMPGLGDSAMPTEAASPDSIATPIADGLVSLLPDGASCDLVGFSFGGLIAGQVAKRLGSRSRSLTLVGASGLGLPYRYIELIPRTQDMEPGALRDAQEFNLRALMLFDPERVDELALAVQAHNDVRARVRSGRISFGESLREALPELCGELNAIWGEHDVTATPGLSGERELLAELHPGLDFRVVPGAGHWVQYEASDAFNNVLLELLACSAH